METLRIVATTLPTIEQVLAGASHVEAMALWQALDQFVSNGEDAEDNGCPHDAWLNPARALLARIEAALAAQVQDDDGD